MSYRRAACAPIRSLRLPPSYWDKVWAAWCPTCHQEAMPLSTGCCGFCDTNLAGQPTRGPYDEPLAGPSPSEDAARQEHTHSIAIAA